MEIADEFFGDAVVVGTGVFRVRTTRSGYLGAERDIILIRAVITVVLTVTNLPGENTASIVALKTITADALIPAITLLFKNYIFMLKTTKNYCFCFQRFTSSSELSPQSSTPLHRSSSKTQT